MTLESIADKLDQLLERQATPARWLPIPADVAYSGVGRETLRKMLRDRRLTAYRPSPRRVVVDREQIDRVILATAQ